MPQCTPTQHNNKEKINKLKKPNKTEPSHHWCLFAGKPPFQFQDPDNQKLVFVLIILPFLEFNINKIILQIASISSFFNSVLWF
jgi:hypothetical protein